MPGVAEDLIRRIGRVGPEARPSRPPDDEVRSSPSSMYLSSSDGGSDKAARLAARGPAVSAQGPKPGARLSASPRFPGRPARGWSSGAVRNTPSSTRPPASSSASISSYLASRVPERRKRPNPAHYQASRIRAATPEAATVATYASIWYPCPRRVLMKSLPSFLRMCDMCTSTTLESVSSSSPKSRLVDHRARDQPAAMTASSSTRAYFAPSRSPARPLESRSSSPCRSPRRQCGSSGRPARPNGGSRPATGRAARRARMA